MPVIQCDYLSDFLRLTEAANSQLESRGDKNSKTLAHGAKHYSGHLIYVLCYS